MHSTEYIQNASTIHAVYMGVTYFMGRNQTVMKFYASVSDNPTNLLYQYGIMV